MRADRKGWKRVFARTDTRRSRVRASCQECLVGGASGAGLEVVIGSEEGLAHIQN